MGWKDLEAILDDAGRALLESVFAREPSPDSDVLNQLARRARPPRALAIAHAELICQSPPERRSLRHCIPGTAPAQAPRRQSPPRIGVVSREAE